MVAEVSESVPAYLRYIRDDIEKEVALALGFSIMSFPVDGSDSPRRQMTSATGAARPASEAENLLYKTLITKEKNIRIIANQLTETRGQVQRWEESERASREVAKEQV